MMKAARNPEAGWSLIELLTAMAILTLLFTPAIAWMSQLQKNQIAGRSHADARDNARVSLSLLRRLIGSAGCNPMGISLPPLRADATEIAFTSDLSGESFGMPDGDLEDPFEQVRVRFDARNHQATLLSGSGTAQPLARCIAQLTWLLRDGLGQPLPGPGFPASVDVRLEAACPQGAAAGTSSSRRVWTTRFPVYFQRYTRP